MLDKGVIVPSKSPYSSPFVMVLKKDGTNRTCIDYRKLNEITTKDAYPLPRLGQTLVALQGAGYFSSLNLAGGYWQVRVVEKIVIRLLFVPRRVVFTNLRKSRLD